MKLILFLMAGFGLTYAISKLGFGSPLRWLAERIPPFINLDKHVLYLRMPLPCVPPTKDAIKSFWIILVECVACLGFWIGLGLSWFFISPASDIAFEGTLLQCQLKATFVDGLCVSGFNLGVHLVFMALDALEDYLRGHTPDKKDDDHDA